jgi:hypothetical protein
MRVRPVFRILGKEGDRGIIYYGTKFAPLVEPACLEKAEGLLNSAKESD